MEKKIISVEKRFNHPPLVNLLTPSNENQICSHYQSPIYKIDSENDSSSLDSFTDGCILFLYVQSLFVSYGVLKKLFDSPSVSFWVSNGLANLVLISEYVDEIESIKESLKGNNVINAYELWQINSGKIAASSYEIFGELKQYEVDIDLNMFSGELLFIAREFASGITNIINKCSLFSPQFTDHYLKIRDKGIKLLKEGFKVENKIKENHSIYEESLFTSYISDLVEINSVISYSLTQGFAGTPPILENPAVIQSYSLLGIGTNYQGYFALYAHVHSKFKEFNIPSILTGKYSTDSGYALGKVPKGMLSKQEKGVDSVDNSSEHLLYFSGRLGFRESKNAISASLFCISLGATNRWNLLTFSHEYMHAHVRELLSIVLGKPEGNTNGTYEEIGDEKFSAIGEKHKKYLKNNNLLGEFSTLDCLAFSIIRFYQFMDYFEECNHLSKNGKPLIRTEFIEQAMTASELRDLIQRNWKLLNELIVHVLDYQYFYDGSDKIYIPVLWESWSTVPQVRGNLGLYLFRTLASLVSSTSSVKIKDSEKAKIKSDEQRFENAFKDLQNKLEEIKVNGKGTLLIEEALEYMGVDENKVELASQITVSRGLIDDIMSIIHHPSIHASVIHDPKITNDGYPFEKLSFSGVKVTSPVAFLQSQVSNEKFFESNDNNEFQSIWNSLACISAIEYKQEAN